MAVSVAPILVRYERDRVDLLGTTVDRVPMELLSGWLRTMLESGDPHQIVTANLDFIAIARRRPAFAQVIAEADLVLCDGKPLQWAAAMQGQPIPARITGMDLVLHTAKLSAERGYSIFLLGAAPGVAEQAADRLREMFPGATIAGCYSPPEGPFSAREDAHIVQLIRAARPHALFVALGAPRQDEWIARHLHVLDVPLCAGIGGVFNFLSGRTRRAPQWMQRAGLEWAFRLLLEPSRLWRRYFLNDLPIFLELLAGQMRQRADRARPRIASALSTAALRLRMPHTRVTEVRGTPDLRRAPSGFARRSARSTPLERRHWTMSDRRTPVAR